MAPMTAIDKALDVLDYLSTNGAPESLGSLVEATGLPKPTVRRLLIGLIENGLVVQNQQKKYTLGNELSDLAARASARTSVAEVGRSAVNELRDHVVGTITLFSFSAQGLLPVLQFEDTASAYFTAPRTGALLQQTAAGKAILAEMYRPAVDHYLGSTAEEADITELHEELNLIRSRGYAVENEESQPGVRAVAAAIRSFTERPIGAIAVTVPVRVTSLPELIRMAPRVVDAAQSVSRAFGGGRDSEGRGQQ